MSVGKMNQLFFNDRYLTPEKRCSKNPSPYRYTYPKKYPIITNLRSREVLFPVDNPSSAELYDPRPPNTFKYQYISEDLTPFQPSPQRLNHKIKECQNTISNYKHHSAYIQNSQTQWYRASTDKAMSSLQEDLSKITFLSEQLQTLKQVLNEKMQEIIPE